MKKEVKTVFGTIEHMTSLVANAELVIRTTYKDGKGVIIGEIKVPVCPHTTGYKEVMFIRNGFSNNNGYTSTPELPFETTKGGFKIWKSFCNEVNKVLSDFIEDN